MSASGGALVRRMLLLQPEGMLRRIVTLWGSPGQPAPFVNGGDRRADHTFICRWAHIDCELDRNDILDRRQGICC
jgi:hypothetical protein